MLFLGDVIHFSQALPGTRYDFWLYYSNSSIENNSSQKITGNSALPVGNGGETPINGVVSTSVPSQLQWLLSWTASITTGMNKKIVQYNLYLIAI